ncbi:non-structural protein NS7a [Rousettus bat coronavirus HKU10]|uniref:Non-structural protein NS7a n=1 Tax=Rousettus bat coronavirus HKU10 TaxID=1241933 RepID=K4KCQ0_9ALPC|nr:non-structural protein NS7a [Rousettus bat coronavirus HKU10]AFU92109.1 non-structural protein NS7a [Rousettus bat coronavirus HKU10]
MHVLIIIICFYLQCFLWALQPLFEACAYHWPVCVYVPSTISYCYSVLGFSLIVIGCLFSALVLDVLGLIALKCLLVCRFLN